MHPEKTKTGLPIGSVHGNPVAPVQLRQPGYPEWSGPVAFPACAISGTVGPPPVTVGRRPTITRGLAFSVFLLFYLPILSAIMMPRTHLTRNILKLL